MKWIEARVSIDPERKQIAQELVTDLFLGIGLSGVAVEDPDETPDEEWGGEAASRPKENAVIGYIPVTEESDRLCEMLETALVRIRKASGVRSRLGYRTIDEEDWAESWKRFFRPERVGKTVVVRPSWQDYDPEPGDRVLEIDPGMAFGTGTHPTTALCIGMLEDHLRAGDTVLDVGTGSGILAIASVLLGADKVWGVDHDPVAVDIACQNRDRNGIEPDRLFFFTGDLVSEIRERFDLVVANILTDVILRLAPDLHRVVKPAGTVLCSGIIETRADAVRDTFSEMGFAELESRPREDWAAMAFRAPG
jgi:ribosomal protein L11 methyltransferase